MFCSDSGCVCVLESLTLWRQWEREVWGLWHHVFIFKVVHGYYQIEITIHSHLFLSHQPPYSISTKFTATRHRIPYLYWKSRILTAVVFSVKFGLIGAALSLHFNRGVKRLQPERVIACSLPFLRNELKESINFPCAEKMCWRFGAWSSTWQL